QVAPPPPAAPSGASATAVNWSKVTLTWTDNSSNEDGYMIQCCITGGTFVEIGRVGPGITTYSDSGLAPNTQYSYRVRAWNAGGVSSFCPSANVTTATLAPGSYTVFTPTATPTNPFEEDGLSVELGMKFTVDVDGFITGVKFYKGTNLNGGAHTASIWTSTGTRLATATFSAESATGWQT